MFKVQGQELLMVSRTDRPVTMMTSPHRSEPFDPGGIVLHDTAGHLEPKYTSPRWFMSPDAKASAHICIERDGEVVQCVPFNRKAWHAGRSSYKGARDVNGFAFGIEIVNPGKMQWVRSGIARSWFGEEYADKDYRGAHAAGQLDLEERRTPEHGHGVWMHYTPEQIASVIAVCNALAEAFDISFITTHWHISPGRKVDPNPLFPLDEVRTAVFGREDPGPITVGDATVIADSNMRGWPYYTSKVIEVVPKGTRVDVLRSDEFPSGECQLMERWHLCDRGEQQGWIHHSLVDLDDH